MLRPRGPDMASKLAFVLMLLLIGLAPTVLYPIFLMKVLCLALFACAFNLLIGYAGLLSFGHAAFFGIGSYVGAWAAKHWHVSAEIAVLLGGVSGIGLGIVFGSLAIRRQGITFTMITLALAQLVYFFCVQCTGFTGGEDGIQQVPRPSLFGLLPLDDDRAMYGFIAVVFLCGFLLIRRIIHSPFGQVLTAIRDNEQRAISLGYRTGLYKWMAFVLSAALSGAAGSAMAIAFGIATLSTVHWTMSGEVVLMTLMGGMGTVFGPVVGAVVLATLETYLAQFGDWVTVTQGAIFIACVLLFRRGVVGEAMAWSARRAATPRG